MLEMEYEAVRWFIAALAYRLVNFFFGLLALLIIGIRFGRGYKNC
jgi:hypothetical protein